VQSVAQVGGSATVVALSHNRCAAAPRDDMAFCRNIRKMAGLSGTEVGRLSALQHHGGPQQADVVLRVPPLADLPPEKLDAS